MEYKNERKIWAIITISFFIIAFYAGIRLSCDGVRICCDDTCHSKIDRTDNTKKSEISPTYNDEKIIFLFQAAFEYRETKDRYDFLEISDGIIFHKIHYWDHVPCNDTNGKTETFSRVYCGGDIRRTISAEYKNKKYEFEITYIENSNIGFVIFPSIQKNNGEIEYFSRIEISGNGLVSLIKDNEMYNEWYEYSVFFDIEEWCIRIYLNPAWRYGTDCWHEEINYTFIPFIVFQCSKEDSNYI